MKIVVLHDLVRPDAPPDLQDNLAQARQVSRMLSKLGHSVSRIPFSQAEDGNDGIVCHNLLEHRPDLVFNLVEAPEGQGHLIHQAPMLLDCLQIPYTGSGAKAQMNTSNKLWAKNILRAAGLPTPDWFPSQAMDGQSGNGFQPGSYILKSVWEHGSFGMDDASVLDCAHTDEMCKHLRLKEEQYGGDWFAERFISGREFNLSLLAGQSGPMALPPAEMLFTGFAEHEHHMVDYAAKWDPESPHYDGTERQFDFELGDGNLLHRLKAYALQCWDLFELRGWARVDFRVDQAGQPWILEVNANPCLALDAGFMAAVRRAGFEPEQSIDLIINDTFPPQQETVGNSGSVIHAGGNGQQHAVMAQFGHTF